MHELTTMRARAGTQPILIKAKPCTVSRHMTKEQAEAAQA